MLGSNMEVDSLVGKFFSYVCKVGGFVELPFIFKPPSPLASEKTEQEAKQWLKPQAGYFAFFKDENEEIVAVRVDLRKKMCQQYVKQGSCRWTQDKCKFWHICKSFIEGNCVGKCSRSHNFFDTGNKESTKEMGLEKLPNETVRNIVAWSLPQVCQLYLKNECKSEKCQYLHVCSKIVQGSSCKCALSHNITDPDNKKILKLYDSVPQQWMDVDFICCSILVPYEQKRIGESKYSSAGGAPAIRKEATASDAIPKVTAPPPNQAGTEIVPALAAPVAYRKTSSSSKPKQAKNVARTQPAAATKTESHVKKQSRQGKSKTFTDHLKITTAVTVVNDLTSNSCSPSSKDGLMFLNIPAKEEENFLDSSLDENNIPGVCLTKKTENRKNTNSSAAELTEAKETSYVPERNTAVRMYSVPNHWSPMHTKEQYKRVPLEAFSSEFKDVEQFFKESMKTTVVVSSIERVQNPFLWEDYQRTKANMSTVNADNYRQIVVNEQKLFHTACPEAVEIICEQNFDRSSQETYLSLLEKENHFALNASYIDGLEHKCSKKDANSSKLMFLAKVLVGSWTKGFYSYTSPPQKDPLNSASDRYDSYVDDETNPTIFVVFNTNQVYPEYIIEYSEESQLAPCDLIADNSSHRDSKTRAMGSKTLLSQSEHYQTPPLGPQASRAPQMQTKNSREPVIQTKVLDAPPLESPFSEGFISQDQVYQALLSQARVSQALLSQTQLFQALLLQAHAFQGPLSQQSQVVQELLSKQLSQEPFLHARSQVSKEQLPNPQTSQVPRPAFHLSLAQGRVHQALLPQYITPDDMSQSQVPPTLLSQANVPHAAEVSQAAVSQAFGSSELQSQAAVPQASLSRSQVPSASASQTVVSQAPVSQAQDKVSVDQAPLSQAQNSPASLSQIIVPQVPQSPVQVRVSQAPSSKAQTFEASVSQTVVPQVPETQAQVSPTPTSHTKVSQSPLVQAQVSAASVSRTVMPQIPLSQASLSLKPVSPSLATPASVSQAYSSHAQLSQNPASPTRSQVEVSQTSPSLALVSRPRVCQVPLLRAKVFQAPLVEAQVCYATLSQAPKVSQGSLLQTRRSYAPQPKMQTSRVSGITQVFRAPILEAQVPQTPLSLAKVPQVPLPKTVVTYASMSSSRVSQPRVSQAVLLPSESLVSQSPISQSRLSQVLPAESLELQGTMSKTPLLSTRVNEAQQSQSRLFKISPSQPQTHQAPIQSSLMASHVPLPSTRMSQASPYNKARLTQPQFSHNQESQSLNVQAYMSQVKNVQQSPSYKIHKQTRISQARTLGSTAPLEEFSSGSSMNSNTPVHSNKFDTARIYSVNSNTDGAPWSTPCDKPLLWQSNYRSHNLAPYPFISSSCSQSPSKSTSLTEHTFASYAHVRRNFFGPKASLEKMKIMSAIIIVFVIGTIIITLRID